MVEYLLWGVAVWAMSSLTLSTGIGGGVVYVPALVFAFDLDLHAAVATGILVQLAGVGTTALTHRRERHTDPALALRLGVIGAAGVAASRAAAGMIPQAGSEIAFVIGMSVVGTWLVWGRRVPLPHPPGSTKRSRLPDVLQASNGEQYAFCRPSQGYSLAAAAGAATGLLGISGAEVQISALILRCGVPTPIAIATGTGAAAWTLLGAAALTAGGVVWSFALLGMPAATAGSATARYLAHHLHPAGRRIGVGLLSLLSALGVASRTLPGQ